MTKKPNDSDKDQARRKSNDKGSVTGNESFENKDRNRVVDSLKPPPSPKPGGGRK